jgi:integrase
MCVEHSPRSEDIAAQLNEWAGEREEGRPKYSPITINHRRTALSNLYRTLGGRACYNPVRDVPRLAEPDEVDRAIPMTDVRLILAQMEKNAEQWGPKAQSVSLSYLRASVLAFTGMRAGELKNIVATDVRLDGPFPVVSIRTLRAARIVAYR